MARLDQRPGRVRRGVRRYYPDHPERIEQMRLAAHIGRNPSADPAVVAVLIDDLAPWLAAEYLAVHGEKAPRP
ncbi:hypothetical protein [Streptomyces sp. NBC_01363]|uniref:hypothetical protein n=1 Tax=Streptomyces sp. NBC_01363 TaxID=2903840 RepID=UPI002B1D595D|nr:hypothetical protein [Streptomyces sp. NBC_01363]